MKTSRPRAAWRPRTLLLLHLLFLAVVRRSSAVPLALTFETSPSNVTQPEDTKLLPPVPSMGRILAPITAYHWRSHDNFPDEMYEKPIYSDIDREKPAFWNYLLDELLLARVPVVAFHGRGCWELFDGDEGQGDMCPRVLRRWLEAQQRLASTGVESVLKVALFIDTAVFRKYINPDGSPMDLAVASNWQWFWAYNIRIFFQTIPPEQWYRHDGRPVISWWNLRDKFFVNQNGNASRMLKWLSDQFLAEFGVRPFMLVQNNWLHEDASLINNLIVDGVHNWFAPVSDDSWTIFTYNLHRGQSFGAVAPSFRLPDTLPGCGASCLEVTRRNGQTLDDALWAGSLQSGITLLEGWTDMAESAGFYRSQDWDYPSQYISGVRRWAEPLPPTLLLQAEGADEFYDTTEENEGRHYADRGLDVGELDGSAGWYVGFIQAGEWIQFNQIRLACGRYRFTARVSTRNADKWLNLKLGEEQLPSVQLPDTGSINTYEKVHVGQADLDFGYYDIRLGFETTGGLNVDWLFLRLSEPCGCQEQLNSLQSCYLQMPDGGTECDECMSPLIEDPGSDKLAFENTVCPAVKTDCPCSGCRAHLESDIQCYSSQVYNRSFECCGKLQDSCVVNTQCCAPLRCVTLQGAAQCRPCRETQLSCSSSSECCPGNQCHTKNKRCCARKGTACARSSDCCGKLSCRNGSCRKGKRRQMKRQNL